MDLITGELRTVSISPKSETRDEQQKVQILSNTSQFDAEHEESITLYLPASPDLGKLKGRVLRIPVTMYAKASQVHRQFWKGAPVGIEILNEKGEFVLLSNRPESLKPSVKTG